MPPRDTDHLKADLHILKPRNAAGRNVPVAIGMGVLLGALVIVCLWIGPMAWYPLLSVAAFLATWEVKSRLTESDWQVPGPVLLAGGQLMIWLTVPWHIYGAMIGLFVSLLLLLVSRLFLHGNQEAPRNWLRDSSVGAYILLWIPLCISFAAMMSVQENPWGAKPTAVIATFMLGVVANDVGGYIAGVFFGKHSMAPAISPKKSWEGFAGSLTLGAVTGVGCAILLLHAPFWQGIILGVCLVVSATLGDLIESQFKRDIGIKDMSDLIPGHGGLMDRLDGMLPSAAMMWLVLTLVALL